MTSMLYLTAMRSLVTKLNLGQVGVILLGPFFLIHLVMSDLIILFIILAFVLYGLLETFQPHIDITQIGARRYRVLLWYTHYDGPEVSRRWIKLGEYGKR